MSQKVEQVIMEKSSTTDLWIHNKWRPALGWAYIAIVVFDFIIAPIAWSWLQLFTGGDLTNKWEPNTLQAGGLFIVSMSAIIGVNSHGRTREKIEGGIREVFLGEKKGKDAPDEET